MSVVQPDQLVQRAKDQTSEQLESLRNTLSELGVESAEVTLSAKGGPVIKSFIIGNKAVQSVAKADPGNIQQVAASQLEIINNYYQSVLNQARQSFHWALIAAASGLIFFLVAIGSLVEEKPERLSTVSLISGALVEVIAGINFYLYARASNQLSHFHTRLDLTQRFLLANSLCENLEGDIKHQTRAELVKLVSTAQAKPHK